MHDIMISYSSRDKVIADAVCNHLENSGIRVWIAPRDILAGESYPTAIIKGIQECSIILLLFTANSNKSVWVPREIERGVTYGKIIIPFKIEEVVPVHSDIELCTCTQHWLDAITPPLEANILKLIDTVKKILGKACEDENSLLIKNYSIQSPLGKFYELARRWLDNNYAYFVLESLTEEQKSILRNSPKNIEIVDENVQLFMLEASLHYGGDWIYWGKKISNQNILAKHLVKMLDITYIRPRYRALYLIQDIEKKLIKSWLKKFDINNNKLIQLLEKNVYTGNFFDYLYKITMGKDEELAKRAKTVIFEINRYDSNSKGLDIFPEF